MKPSTPRLSNRSRKHKSGLACWRVREVMYSRNERDKATPATLLLERQLREKIATCHVRYPLGRERREGPVAQDPEGGFGAAGCIRRASCFRVFRRCGSAVPMTCRDSDGQIHTEHARRTAKHRPPGNPSKTSLTDWKRLASLSGEELDTSDIPEPTPEQLARAVLRKGLKRAFDK